MLNLLTLLHGIAWVVPDHIFDRINFIASFCAKLIFKFYKKSICGYSLEILFHTNSKLINTFFINRCDVKIVILNCRSFSFPNHGLSNLRVEVLSCRSPHLFQVPQRNRPCSFRMNRANSCHRLNTKVVNFTPNWCPAINFLIWNLR